MALPPRTSFVIRHSLIMIIMIIITDSLHFFGIVYSCIPLSASVSSGLGGSGRAEILSLKIIVCPEFIMYSEFASLSLRCVVVVAKNT